MKNLLAASIWLTSVLAVNALAQRPPRTADIHPTNPYPSRTAPDIIKETTKLSMVPSGSEASLEGRVIAVNVAADTLVIEQPKSKKRFRVPLNSRTELKADKGTVLAKKEKVLITDFKPGQLVKVFFTSGPTVLEVRLRREKTQQKQTVVPPDSEAKKPESQQPDR